MFVLIFLLSVVEELVSSGEEVKEIPDKSLWTLNNLVYAGAVVVTERLSAVAEAKQKGTTQSAISKRLESIKKLRQRISSLKEEISRRKRGTLKPSRKERFRLHRFKRMFGARLRIRDIDVLVEKHKQRLRLRIKSAQIKPLQKTSSRSKTNQWFHVLGPRSLDSSMEGGSWRLAQD